MITQENIPYTADEIKAMVKTCEKYNKALERASKLRVQNPFDTVGQMVEHIFPELKEDNDEIIRKWLIDWANAVNWSEQFTITKEQVIAWLEKQKNTSDKEYVFRPVAGDTIEKAAEQAVKLDGKVVLAFNGFYTPVKGKTIDEILTEYDHWLTREEALAWLEKQGQEPKKVTVVDFKAKNWYVSKVDGKIYDATYVENIDKKNKKRPHWIFHVSKKH